ncbi:MAG: hypothetical protein ACOH1T_02095 [Microbacteriaceae bacterium]
MFRFEPATGDAFDAAWPAIASQLWGALSPSETPLRAGEVAAVVARLVAARRSRDKSSPRHEAVELEIATGAVTRVPSVVHPECECAGLDRPVRE